MIVGPPWTGHALTFTRPTMVSRWKNSISFGPQLEKWGKNDQNKKEKKNVKHLSCELPKHHDHMDQTDGQSHQAQGVVDTPGRFPRHLHHVMKPKFVEREQHGEKHGLSWPTYRSMKVFGLQLCVIIPKTKDGKQFWCHKRSNGDNPATRPVACPVLATKPLGAQTAIVSRRARAPSMPSGWLQTMGLTVTKCGPHFFDLSRDWVANGLRFLMMEIGSCLKSLQETNCWISLPSSFSSSRCATPPAQLLWVPGLGRHHSPPRSSSPWRVVRWARRFFLVKSEPKTISTWHTPGCDGVGATFGAMKQTKLKQLLIISREMLSSWLCVYHCLPTWISHVPLRLATSTCSIPKGSMSGLARPSNCTASQLQGRSHL